MKFSVTIGDLTVLSCCDDLITSKGPHTTAQIVAMCDDGSEHVHTVAYWVRSSDGFSLAFVGTRPFVHKNIFMEVAAIGQRLLDEHCQLD